MQASAKPFVPPPFGDGPVPAGSAGASESRLEAAFEQAAFAIAHVSRDGRFLRANRRFCALAGRRSAELMRLGFRDISRDLGGALGPADALLAGSVADYALEKKIVRPDGRTAWARLNVSLIRDGAGRPDFFLVLAEDIEARKAAEERASHDPLTGLLNGRALAERLERELDRAANDGTPLTLALIELDHFGGLVDTLGLGESERCLERVGRALTETCRPGDSIARLDGGCFALVLPRLERRSATGMLGRLRKKILGLATAETWPVGCTIAAASRLRDGATAESLIARAEARMEEARTARA